MADEDEIDILGDFQLDAVSNLYEGPLVNSELLNCDYTIHPQWLLDRPSTNPDNWYATDTFTSLGEKPQTSEFDSVGHLSTENSITDESGWTEKEKNLLERGIEIFGKSNGRLAQFIGSKSAPEVKYYLKNFYLENHTNRRSSECALEGDVLDDAQIPASIEEVIAAVSTGKPTVQMTKPKSRKKSFSTSTFSDHSDKELGGENALLSPKKKKSHAESCRHKKHRRTSFKHKKTTVSGVKFKLRSKLKVPSYDRLAEQKMEKKNLPKGVKFRMKSKLKFPGYDNVIKQKTIQIVNAKSNENEIKKVEITTGHGLAVPICEGEEIIKLRHNSDESDTDVDIDVELSDSESKPKKEEPIKSVTESESIPKPKLIPTKCPQVEKPSCALSLSDLPDVSDFVKQQLTTLEKPKSEFRLDKNNVTDLEKAVHSEYFLGSSVKTPARYMKFRNHILQGWHSQKPKYLTKTVSRQGLRNCGDVNCFGRIHYFLEQIGAINFGCEQVTYERPLFQILREKFLAKEKKKQELLKNKPKNVNPLGCRARNKIIKFNNQGEGGHTMSHDENGVIIKHTVVNEDTVVKPKQYIKKPTIRLVYCRPFTQEMMQPYSIKINVLTLLTMDFHAHNCLTEVMGLIGGHWNPHSNTLTISHYEPCLNLASSVTHCDMCPISQARAADTIHSMGLDILGWFHSHPTFAPEPSHQDLETQQSVQQWIGQNKPCIGMILSPFSINGALIASPFRCMIVDKKRNFEDQIVPYKFKVEIEAGCFRINEFLNHLSRIKNFEYGNMEKHKVDFNKPYFNDPSITFLEKYVTSVRMHFAKLGITDKICENIFQGIFSICTKK